LVVVLSFLAAGQIVLAETTSAPTVFVLSSIHEQTELHKGVQLYEDKGAALRLRDVSSSLFADKWNTAEKASAISLGFTRSAYWMRFTVRNTTQPNYNVWLFEVAFPPLDSLDIFVPQPDGTMRLFRTGDHVPFGQREIQYRTFIVPLSLPDSLPKTVYLRVRTTSSMILPMTILTREAQIKSGIASLLIFGFIVGVVVVLALYNFALYLIAREEIYLRYLLYISSVVLFVASYNGLTAEFLFPESGFGLQYSIIFSVGVGAIGFALTTQAFLQTKQFSPTMHRILLVMEVYWGGLTLVGIVADYLTINFLQVASYLPSLVILSVIIVRMQSKGKQRGGYFLFLNAAVVGGGLAGCTLVLTSLNLLPNNSWTRNSLQFSLLFDALMFSLALAQRFQTLRNETLQAQEETLRLQRDQNTLLQRAVDERTVQLQQRNAELAAMNDEKNELMGIVAHDLKNPIGAVRSLADLVQSGVIEASQSTGILEKIVQTADRMLELVTNLLDSNRLEAGAMSFACVRFDITPFIDNALAQYSPQASAKNIALHGEFHSTSNIIVADEQATMQVLDNLLSNAIKYSPHGKNVFVRVVSNNAFVRIEVQDEGQGISPDEMKKLFGKFARLSAQPTGGEHSTGLGLSIVKKMVEAMNGRVWCESESGKGATFIVELPKAAIPTQ
jgi:signal transduction histidine kinase